MTDERHVEVAEEHLWRAIRALNLVQSPLIHELGGHLADHARALHLLWHGTDESSVFDHGCEA